MSEMLKGVQAAVDAHENAWHIQNRLMCLPKAVDHHHQKTIDLMKKEMGKLDEQLDQIDETLGRIFRDLVQPEDQGKIKNSITSLCDIRRCGRACRKDIMLHLQPSTITRAAMAALWR